MDNKKIKRIIVREGLIILFVFLLLLINMLLPKQIVIKDRPKGTQEMFEVKYDITLKRNFFFEKVYTVLWDKEKEAAAGTKWIKSEHNVIKEAISLFPLKSKIFIFLLFVYPFYLLVRFIIWAVKMLMEK